MRPPCQRGCLQNYALFPHRPRFFEKGRSHVHVFFVLLKNECTATLNNGFRHPDAGMAPWHVPLGHGCSKMLEQDKNHHTQWVEWHMHCSCWLCHVGCVCNVLVGQRDVWILYPRTIAVLIWPGMSGIARSLSLSAPPPSLSLSLSLSRSLPHARTLSLCACVLPGSACTAVGAHPLTVYSTLAVSLRTCSRSLFG